MTATRGTSNTNARGSAEDRRRRKLYLLDAYRADVDILPGGSGEAGLLTPREAEWDSGQWLWKVPIGRGIKACRCYRCGDLLTFDTVTIDRIKPGCKGGKYTRDNIRPACAFDNSSTGGALANRGGSHAQRKRLGVKA